MIDNGVCPSTTVVKVCFPETHLRYAADKHLEILGLKKDCALPIHFSKMELILSVTTVHQVDSAREHGILLEAVQVLTDLNLSIKKAYISSDGRWLMDGKQIDSSHDSSAVYTFCAECELKFFLTFSGIFLQFSMLLIKMARN